MNISQLHHRTIGNHPPQIRDGQRINCQHDALRYLLAGVAGQVLRAWHLIRPAHALPTAFGLSNADKMRCWRSSSMIERLAA
jgi:hypothetical protein